MHVKLCLSIGLTLGAIGCCLAFVVAPSRNAAAAAPAAAAAKAQPQPVEPDMHEFMEYLFEPAFKRLKASMANAPADNAAWKGIKGDALTLAEAGNLLLSRVPEEDGEAWGTASTAVREAGARLYQAAKKKDFKSARTHYEALLVQCNACHDRFAGGEHQLSP